MPVWSLLIQVSVRELEWFSKEGWSMVLMMRHGNNMEPFFGFNHFMFNDVFIHLGKDLRQMFVNVPTFQHVQCWSRHLPWKALFHPFKKGYNRFWKTCLIKSLSRPLSRCYTNVANKNGQAATIVRYSANHGECLLNFLKMNTSNPGTNCKNLCCLSFVKSGFYCDNSILLYFLLFGGFEKFWKIMPQRGTVNIVYYQQEVVKTIILTLQVPTCKRLDSYFGFKTWQCLLHFNSIDWLWRYPQLLNLAKL